MRDQKFILSGDDGRTPAPVDLMTWARWFETADRHVADEAVGKYRVSTVFLGIDHRFTGDGPPLLFETMVFRDETGIDVWCERAATWSEAEACHSRGVAHAASLAVN